MQTCSRSLNLADVLTRSDKQLSILACSPEPGPWLNSLVQSFCLRGVEKELLRKRLYTRGRYAKKKSGCETYLEVPLQRCDILTAHLNIIQSHLRQKGKSDWRFVTVNRTPSDSLQNLPRCNWRPASRQLIQIQLNKLVKRLFDVVILKMCLCNTRKAALAFSLLSMPSVLNLPCWKLFCIRLTALLTPRCMSWSVVAGKPCRSLLYSTSLTVKEGQSREWGVRGVGGVDSEQYVLTRKDNVGTWSPTPAQSWCDWSWRRGNRC